MSDNPTLGTGRRGSVLSQTVGRLRASSLSTVANKVMDLDPALGAWQAAGLGVAYAPNIKDLRSTVTGGDNIKFDAHGHSARHGNAEELKNDHMVKLAIQRRATMTILDSKNGWRTDEEEQAMKNALENTGKFVTQRNEKETPLTTPTPTPLREPEELPQKATWPVAIKHALHAFRKFFLTLTGFLITLYGINVIAWGAMLFFLELHAAPAMDHPDNGNANSSPRKIWLEIDSQILNALFCLTAWGLAPWRFRDLYWTCVWRLKEGTASKEAVAKLTKRNSSWFRMRECDMGEWDEDLARFNHMQTFTGEVAPPTATWKLDFVIWAMALNSLLQVGLAFFMWHWNRIERPGWGVGTFLGAGCMSSLLGGGMCWWEGRKIKKIEGPKIKAKEDV
ncbi:hypothetical protein BDV97DRAFT_361466 [Delphinella strobiligena]|nr:hypothetical protein BDV97DRAFT_361466 [Delphinella strobiligena]